jgi:hypothetical protein
MGILVQSAVSPRRCEADTQNTYYYRLDHYVQSAIDIEVFRACYGQSVRQSEFGKVLSKSSLSMYKNCRVSMGRQLYLSEDFNFEASRLKLLASGILRISKHIKNYFTQSIVCQILKTCIICYPLSVHEGIDGFPTKLQKQAISKAE